MKEVFYRLNERQLIERVPGKKGSASAWRLCTGTGGAVEASPVKDGEGPADHG
jgi:hypothetical protein